MRQAFRAKNLLYALGLGGFLGALAACSSFVHGYTAGEYAYRMLPAAVGPGAYRLHLETSHDRVLRAYVQDHGTPDYLYVIDEAKIHLVYVRDDMLVTFTRGWTADGTPSVQRPIPTAMMAEIAETDRRLILASRGELRPETPSTSREAEAQPPSAAATGASEYSIGTCFAISDEGRLVTAAHVVEGSSELVVRLSDGRALPATVERLSTPTDLALLHVDAKPPAYLSPGPAGSVHIGDRVFTLGYPVIDVLGADVKFAEGSVASLSGPGGDATYMQVSVPTHPGNSGGPLVTEEGFLAGVVLATAAPGRFLDASGTLPQNVNWGVRAEYVMALLERPLAASPLPTSREKAIERARAAVCLAIAHRR